MPIVAASSSEPLAAMVCPRCPLRLLTGTPPWRQMLYATAIATGLRLNELRSLDRATLDVENGRLTVPGKFTKNGKPVALLLSVKDAEEIERLLLAYSPKFKNIMHVAERQVREGRGIKHDDFWRETEAEYK